MKYGCSEKNLSENRPKSSWSGVSTVSLWVYYGQEIAFLPRFRTRRPQFEACSDFSDTFSACNSRKPGRRFGVFMETRKASKVRKEPGCREPWRKLGWTLCRRGVIILPA